MPSNIIQIQLLDDKTGAVIETVIPETEARAVLLSNGQDLQTYLSSLVLQKGDKGDTGATGAAGPAGTAGSKLHNVTGAPSTGLGVVGDWALDTASSDIYEKTAAAVWTKRGSFKGASGATGATGATGSQGPKGDTGAQGLQGFQGPKGDTGAAGPAGVTGAKGDKGDKGDPGDNVKYGTALGTATQVRLFFKKM